jgi:hypothetical protein
MVLNLRMVPSQPGVLGRFARVGLYGLVVSGSSLTTVWFRLVFCTYDLGTVGYGHVGLVPLSFLKPWFLSGSETSS